MSDCGTELRQFTFFSCGCSVYKVCLPTIYGVGKCKRCARKVKPLPESWQSTLSRSDMEERLNIPEANRFG